MYEITNARVVQARISNLFAVVTALSAGMSYSMYMIKFIARITNISPIAEFGKSVLSEKEKWERTIPVNRKKEDMIPNISNLRLFIPVEVEFYYYYQKNCSVQQSRANNLIFN